jgi:hypothetical protein
MTTETKEVAADDFDAAFAEAIAAEGSGEPASGKPAEKEKVAAAAAAATTAATEAEVTAEETAQKAADEKATADAAAATKKIVDDKAATDAAAAAEKAEDDKVAADAAAAAKKIEDDKFAATPEGKVAAEVAAKAATEKAAADATAAAAKKIVDDKAAADAAAAAEKAETERKAALEIPEPVLTDEQKTALASFETEWPDIAKATKVQQAHAIAGIEARFARALTAVVEKVYSDLSPMFQTVQNVEHTTFRSEVLKQHSDFDTVSPQLTAWIEKQPSYLVDAYKKVYNEGSVQEVIELVSQYKKSNGPGSETPGTPPASDKPTDQQTAAARAAAAKKAAELAPVQSKRTTPTPQGSDPNDFDGAFAEATAR